MPKGLCFTAVVFLSFFLSFRRLISEVTERISTTLGHIFAYACYLKKFGPNSRGINPPPMGWGQKTLFGTDFELWPNISLQRNMTSTIGKKLVNLQGLPNIIPKFGERWSRNGWERLASFCRPPKCLHLQTLPALPHGRQQAIFGTCYVAARAYGLEQQNAGGLTLGFAIHLFLFLVPCGR